MIILNIFHDFGDFCAFLIIKSRVGRLGGEGDKLVEIAWRLTIFFIITSNYLGGIDCIIIWTFSSLRKINSLLILKRIYYFLFSFNTSLMFFVITQIVTLMAILLWRNREFGKVGIFVWIISFDLKLTTLILIILFVIHISCLACPWSIYFLFIFLLLLISEFYFIFLLFSKIRRFSSLIQGKWA